MIGDAASAVMTENMVFYICATAVLITLIICGTYFAVKRPDHIRELLQRDAAPPLWETETTTSTPVAPREPDE